MDMSNSADLKEIPDLSKAINVKKLMFWRCSSLVALPSSIGNLNKLYQLDLRECSSLVALPSSIGNLSELYELDLRECTSLVELPSSIGNLSELYQLKLSGCTSLVALPSSIGNLSKLYELDLTDCSNLKFLPADVDLESLVVLKLNRCSQLRTFPRISRNIAWLHLEDTALEGEEDSSWIENIPHLSKLYWNDVPLNCMPPNFNPEDLEYLVMRGGRLKKLWGGVKSLEYLLEMHLSGCESLVEIPDLSMAIALRYLELENCKSLVMLPSSIRNLHQLKRLNMKGCTMLEVLPVDINLYNLEEVYLSGCSKLRNFPQISNRIEHLYLDDTGIEEIPFWITGMYRLWILKMRRCKNLKNISAAIFELKDLTADFSDCGGITTICDHLPGPHDDFFDISSYRLPGEAPFKFNNCFNLDRDAQEIIVQSYPNMAVIPGGEVPDYFMHRACGSSLSILLSESSLSQESILLKTCIVVGLSSHRTTRCFKVLQSFRGQKEEIPRDVEVDECTYEMDHLVLFILRLQIKRVDHSPSELNNNVLLLEFCSHNNQYCGGFVGLSDFSCGSCSGCHEQNSAIEEIKGCGARVMDISKTDYEKIAFLSDFFVGSDVETYGESDEENNEESDQESNRSRKTMWMTVLTSQEHFNSLSIQTAVLSLGLAGASGEVSSGSKLASPQGNFCDNGASSFETRLNEESLHSEFMII